MTGEVDKTRYHKLLAEAMSTPVENKQRVQVPIPFAKLSPYTVNVRSFHPNKYFERAGFRGGFKSEPQHLGY